MLNVITIFKKIEIGGGKGGQVAFAIARQPFSPPISNFRKM
jgi:hypothetical protein